jgi:hypothetical protein
MPTARELLEQADALMRRNRKRGRDRNREGPPTLTDVLVDRNAALAPTVILPEAMRSQAEAVVANAPQADPIALDTLSDVPVLTDVVDVWPATAEERGPPALTETEKSALDDALEADALAGSTSPSRSDTPTKVEDVATQPTVEAAVEARSKIRLAEEASDDDKDELGKTSSQHRVLVPDWHEENELEATSDEPSSVSGTESARPSHEVATAQSHSKLAADNASVVEDEFILDIPPVDEATAAVADHPAKPSAHAVAVAAERVLPGSPDWNAMAEEIRMQVLQRLDLLTDTGLRNQLGVRLQPIVDRASADLVETINRELGELVRGYVAEAIEREIDSWRKRS